jgi:hypothetical protein
MRLVVNNEDPLPNGLESTLPPSGVVAEFGSSVLAGNMTPGGEMKLHLLVPFNQVPLAQALFKFVGGAMFKVTFERVAVDELPEGGWNDS